MRPDSREESKEEARNTGMHVQLFCIRVARCGGCDCIDACLAAPTQLRRSIYVGTHTTTIVRLPFSDGKSSFSCSVHLSRYIVRNNVLIVLVVSIETNRRYYFK